MSTNGFVSFIAKGERKDVYNHSDSYPSGLGLAVLSWLRVARDGGLPEAISRLRVVDDFSDDNVPPTEADKLALAEYTDSRVGGPDEHWYRLTRNLQGNPHAMLTAGYAYGQGEPYGYVYVIDADAETFRVEGDGTPASWSWSSLPTEDEFLAKLGE